MAAAESPHRHPEPAPGTVSGDGLACVFGTRRNEATGRRAVGAQVLVDVDGAEHDSRGAGGFHGFPLERSFRIARSVLDSSEYGAEAAPGAARTRYADPASNRGECSRTAARKRRRTRLRVTASPTERPTEKATRGGARSGPSTAVLTSRNPVRRRRPRASARNDDWPRTRQIRRKAWSGPWYDGDESPRGPLDCACGAESRASSSVSGCSAGMSVSPMASSNARAEVGPRGGRAACFSARARK
jgi:hypothetical protein